MIHQAPAGARDLLPLEVEQKSWINDRLQEVFQRWGYKRIVTSTIERVDTLIAGGAIQPSTVIALQNSAEGRLGLRPELTASIARAAVTRMDPSATQRLCYRANIFRHPPDGYHGRQLEFYQAGVELLFTGGVLADAEILLLVADCLAALGIESWQLLLGEAQLTRSLLSVFPDCWQRQVRHALANLDRIAIENWEISPELRERALFVFDLRGKPADVLQKVAQLELEPAGRESVANLKSLMELIGQASSKPLPIILDLSLVQTFDYYTGIIFDLVSTRDNKHRVLGQGGRYDRLLGVYHPQGKSYPGIGFSFNLEDLHGCLLSSAHLPKQTPPSDWLVIPENPEAVPAALTYADKLRQTKNMVRVELQLEPLPRDQIRDYAEKEGISRLVSVTKEGVPRIETIRDN